MTRSTTIRFKAYPSVMELLLQFSHRRISEQKKWPSDTSQPSFQTQGSVYYFTKPGYYDLKISPDEEKLMIVTNTPCPYNEDLMRDLEENVSTDNVEISNKLASFKHPKKDSPDYSEYLERRENHFSQIIKQFKATFPELKEQLVPNPSGHGIQMVKKLTYETTDGTKTLHITLYHTGNVTTRGANLGYHEEFWKLYLEIQEKILENEYEKESN
ncbi:TPA: hypothetical protein ACGORX_001198 [Streptococcus suis]